MAPMCRDAYRKSSPRRAHGRRVLGIVRSVIVELNRNEGAVRSRLSQAASTMSSLARNAVKTCPHVRARGHLLEAIPIASAVQAHITTIEMVANIREFLLQLRPALTCFGRIRKQLAAKPRSNSQAVTS